MKVSGNIQITNEIIKFIYVLNVYYYIYTKDYANVAELKSYI